MKYMFAKIAGAIVLAVALSGCGAVSALSGGFIDSGRAPSGVFNGSSNQQMSKVKLFKSDYDPRTGKNPILYKQYQAVADLAERLGIQIKWQTSSKGQACLTNGAPYLIAGTAGGATEGAFAPSALVPAAVVNGTTYTLGGCVNGLVVHSYGGDSASGDSIEKAMRDIENDGTEYMVVVGTKTVKDKDGKEHQEDITESLFHNLHVTASYDDSGNRDDAPAPEFAKHMPDFHGAAVGVPTTQNH